jgi:hypothetical protein
MTTLYAVVVTKKDPRDSYRCGEFSHSNKFLEVAGVAKSADAACAFARQLRDLPQYTDTIVAVTATENIEEAA